MSINGIRAMLVMMVLGGCIYWAIIVLLRG